MSMSLSHVRILWFTENLIFIENDILFNKIL